jgi:hypothetical protein
VILAVLLLAAVIALSGGFIVGVAVGAAWQRGRRDAGELAPHEALARVYQMPTPTEILSELRGPLGKGP